MPDSSGIEPLAAISAHSGASDSASVSISAANTTSAAISLAALRVSSSAARMASRFTVAARPTALSAPSPTHAQLGLLAQVAVQDRGGQAGADAGDQQAGDQAGQRVQAGRRGERRRLLVVARASTIARWAAPPMLFFRISR